MRWLANAALERVDHAFEQLHVRKVINRYFTRLDILAERVMRSRTKFLRTLKKSEGKGTHHLCGNMSNVWVRPVITYEAKQFAIGNVS